MGFVTLVLPDPYGLAKMVIVSEFTNTGYADKKGKLWKDYLGYYFLDI